MGGEEGVLDADRFYKSIPEALFISGLEGEIVYVNQAVHELLEYDREELAVIPLADLFRYHECKDVLIGYIKTHRDQV